MNRNEYDAWLGELMERDMTRRRRRRRIDLERPVRETAIWPVSEQTPDDHFDIDEDLFSDATPRPVSPPISERLMREYATSTGRTVEDIVSWVPSTLHDARRPDTFHDFMQNLRAEDFEIPDSIRIDYTTYRVSVDMDYSAEPVRETYERVRSACADVGLLSTGTTAQVRRAGLRCDRSRFNAARDAGWYNGANVRVSRILPRTWSTALKNAFERVARHKITMHLYNSSMPVEDFRPFVQIITHRFLRELFPHENHLINEPGIGRVYADQILRWLHVGLEQVESEGSAPVPRKATPANPKKKQVAIISVRKIRIRR